METLISERAVIVMSIIIVILLLAVIILSALYRASFDTNSDLYASVDNEGNLLFALLLNPVKTITLLFFPETLSESEQNESLKDL